MTGKKAIVAMINGELYIDPSDANILNTESFKKQLYARYGTNIKVNIAPIKEWMPASGTKALMDEAIRDMSTKGISPKPVPQQPIIMNRKARKILKRK